MQCFVTLNCGIVGGRSAGLVYCIYVLASNESWQNIEWWWCLFVAELFLILFCCKILAVMFKIHVSEL
jgi:hypothetical protein